MPNFVKINGNSTNLITLIPAADYLMFTFNSHSPQNFGSAGWREGSQAKIGADGKLSRPNATFAL